MFSEALIPMFFASSCSHLFYYVILQQANEFRLSQQEMIQRDEIIQEALIGWFNHSNNKELGACLEVLARGTKQIPYPLPVLTLFEEIYPLYPKEQLQEWWIWNSDEKNTLLANQINWINPGDQWVTDIKSDGPHSLK